MSKRGARIGRAQKTLAYGLALFFHVVILGLMLVNLSGTPERIDAFDADKIDVVKASAVDEAELKNQIDQIKKADENREKERLDRQKELERLAAEQERKEEDLAQLEEKQKEEIEKTKRLEAERKAIALKKKEDEERAEKERIEREAQAKRERDRLAKEKREREEAERKRQEAQERFEEQLRAEQQALAEKRARERTTTAINQAIARIGEKIKALRTITPGVEPWRKTVVLIRIDNQGRVESVRTIESSGDPQYDADSEAAVYKASPLPLPDQTLYPDAYQRMVKTPIEFEIRVNQSQL